MLALSEFRGTNCMICHVVDEGTVLGAVRIDYSTAALDSSVQRDLLNNIGINSAVRVIALILISALLGHLVSNPLTKLTSLMQAVAEGQMDKANTFDMNSNDEIGDLANYFNQAIKRFSGIIDETRVKSDENQRIKTALDYVSSGVMVADTDYNIIYMNKSVKQMLKQAEADIRTAIPDFSADNLVGTNIDRFHKPPAQQASQMVELDVILLCEVAIPDCRPAGLGRLIIRLDFGNEHE